MQRQRSRPIWVEWACAALLLCAGVLARLYRLAGPAASEGSWRETDGLAMARNLHDGLGTVLAPVVDWSGGSAVASELPLIPWLAAKLYIVTGVGEAPARSIIVAFSVLLMVATWRVARSWLGPVGALFVLLVVAAHPLTLYYGRSFLPDVPALALGVTALWAFGSALGAQGWRAGVRFVAGGLALALAVAIKPIALVLGPVFVVEVLRRRGWRGLVHPAVPGIGLAALLPVVWLAWHEHTIYAATGNTFGIFLGHDKFQPWLLFEGAWWQVVGPRLLSQTLPMAMIPVTLVGLAFLAVSPRRFAVALAWIGSGVAWIFVVAEGNLDMPHYQLPAVIPVALCVGGAAVWVHERLEGMHQRLYGAALGLSLSLGLLSGLNYARQSLVPHETYLADAASVDRVLPDGAKVLLFGGATHHRNGDDFDPRPFYHTNTRGWVLDDAGYALPAIAAYCHEGARFGLIRNPDPHLVGGSASHTAAPAEVVLWAREVEPLVETTHLTVFPLDCARLPPPTYRWAAKPGTAARPVAGGFEIVSGRPDERVQGPAERSLR